MITPSGPILSDAKGHYLKTLPGMEGLKHETIIRLSSYNNNLHQFYLTGKKNTTAFIYYVALQVCVTTAARAVKVVDLPVFSPAILAERNGIEWRLVAEDTLSLEFNNTDEAVQWRPECPQETAEFRLVISYHFERDK